MTIYGTPEQCKENPGFYRPIEDAYSEIKNQPQESGKLEKEVDSFETSKLFEQLIILPEDQFLF